MTFRLVIIFLLAALLKLAWPEPAAAQALTTATLPVASLPSTALTTSTLPTTSTLAEERWLAPGSSEPISLILRNEVLLDPATRGIQVVNGQWRLPWLKVALLGGAITIEGHGSMAAGRISDLATTITLSHVDMQALLKRLAVSRANEIEAIASGWLAVQVHNGDWRWVEVHLAGEPGTARLSRKMIQDLLVPSLGGSLTAAQIDATLTKFFGGDPMIPLESLTFDGKLGAQTLDLKIPLHNKALNIVIEPRIQRDLLWQIWAALQRAGARNIEGLRSLK